MADKKMEELLARVGWTQAFFARRIGVSVKTVNRWCTGKGSQGYTVAVAYLALVERMLG